jgi:glycosyltransferase involved in cell wall biosynthesis
MVKIGFVSSFMPPHLGGLEVAAKTIFDAYRKNGFEARWITSRVPENLPSHGNGTIRVDCWNGLERWFGVPWPIWGPVGIRELAALIRWADVVHVNDCLYFCSVLATLIARRLNKPLIVSQHIGFVRYPSIIFNGLERLAYTTLGRAVLRSATHIAFCTPAAQEFVTALLKGVRFASSHIPYGIDIERFRPPTLAERASVRRQWGVPESKKIVLFAGRLVEKKGVQILLEVRRRMTAYHFLMVGDGPLRQTSADNLTWIPFVPPQDMEKIYQAADVFFLPSHSEGFPISILEAMATGIPIVTSKGQTFGKILEHGGAGLLSERDPAAFCDVLSKVLESPALAHAMNLRSREIVERDYNLGGVGIRYRELVKELKLKKSS